MFVCLFVRSWTGVPLMPSVFDVILCANVLPSFSNSNVFSMTPFLLSVFEAEKLSLNGA